VIPDKKLDVIGLYELIKPFYKCQTCIELNGALIAIHMMNPPETEYGDFGMILATNEESDIDEGLNKLLVYLTQTDVVSYRGMYLTINLCRDLENSLTKEEYAIFKYITIG